MSKRELYEQKTEQLLTPIVEEYGFELVDVEYVKEGSTWYLRSYIDKPGGISIDDCEKVSRRLSDLLDQEDFIEDAYIMEVSSPGLGRPLKKEKDFRRSLGEEVEIRTYRMIDKQKEFTGILKDYDENTVTITLADETEKTFDKDEIFKEGNYIEDIAFDVKGKQARYVRIKTEGYGKCIPEHYMRPGQPARYYFDELTVE